MRVMASSKANLSIRGCLRNTWNSQVPGDSLGLCCEEDSAFLDKKCFQPVPVSVASSKKGRVGTIRRFKGRLLLNTTEQLQTVATSVFSKCLYCKVCHQ